MSVRTATWVICDLCRRKALDATDELLACRAARRAGWRTVSLMACYGIEGNVCPACAEGKVEEELFAAIMATGEEQP